MLLAARPALIVTRDQPGSSATTMEFEVATAAGSKTDGGLSARRVEGGSLSGGCSSKFTGRVHWTLA